MWGGGGGGRSLCTSDCPGGGRDDDDDGGGGAWSILDDPLRCNISLATLESISLMMT